MRIHDADDRSRSRVATRFPTLARARAEMELWRVDYSTQRPRRRRDARIGI